MWKVAERNIGRAGNRQQADMKKKIWNQRYGEGNWQTGYEVNDEFMTREEAIEKIYFKSYFDFLDNNPNLVKRISEYGGVFNPHASYTNSVDLQALAVEEYFKRNNLQFKGPKNKILAAGVWQPRNNKNEVFAKAQQVGISNDGDRLIYPRESYSLSPFKIMCWHDKTLSVEAFWQSPAKCLAVKTK